jgi:hypothetical protein
VFSKVRHVAFTLQALHGVSLVTNFICCQSNLGYEHCLLQEAAYCGQTGVSWY